MSVDKIEESGMLFLTHSAQTYRIEQDPFIIRIQGVKLVEYLELDGFVNVVEAKSSMPKITSAQNDNDFVSGIADKFSNSILLLNSLVLCRYDKTKTALPFNIQPDDLGKLKYRIYLVVKNAHEDWLPPLKDELAGKLRKFLKCWNINDSCIKVLNEVLAREIRLIE